MAFIGPYQIYTIVTSELVARVADWDKLATSINAGLATAKTGAVADAKTYADSTFIPAWKASTAYTAGQRAISPGGDVVAAKVAFTSGLSYLATNWNASTQDGRLTAVESKNTEQDTAITTARTGAVADAKTYTDAEVAVDRGRLTAIESKNTAQDGRLDGVEAKNTTQDGRLTGLESLQPVKAVRLELGKWVWDVANATHYLFPEPGGGFGIHATAWPVPNPTTHSLDW